MAACLQNHDNSKLGSGSSDADGAGGNSQSNGLGYRGHRIGD
jgi:hypothetical protein